MDMNHMTGLASHAVETRPIAALVRYGRNARTHSKEQVEQIAASIRRFGFVNPVLVDDKGNVVAGHGRLDAATSLGMADVPVLRISAIEGGIRFSSDHYFLQLGRLRLRIPRWLAPGLLTIDHVDCGGGSFTFTLALRHRLLDEVMMQHSRFCDQCNRHGGLNHD